MNRFAEKGMGWLPDHTDIRDLTAESTNVKKLLTKAGVNGSTTEADKSGTSKDDLPLSVDLRSWCSPIEDQGPLGSCTSHVGVAVIEYFERKASGKHIDASRLFLYKVSRNLSHIEGDSGSQIRTTMAALRIFGVPPEEYWPYVISDYDKEPPAFCYSFAQNYQSISYFRLDPHNVSNEEILYSVKGYLASGFPCIFGLTAYSCVNDDEVKKSGKIPYPSTSDVVLGGHSLMAVGYDDSVEIQNSKSEEFFKGAFLVRNSWGPDWGDHGYGWLPYEYLNQGIALDWWTVIKQEWVDTGHFGL
jgi:C1A family cysteine protease